MADLWLYNDVSISILTQKAFPVSLLHSYDELFYLDQCLIVSGRLSCQTLLVTVLLDKDMYSVSVK